MTAHQIDITHEMCPMTFVRVKLKLEELLSQDHLTVDLKGSTPLKNVTRSVLDEGHQILNTEDLGDQYYRLLVKVEK